MRDRAFRADLLRNKTFVSVALYSDQDHGHVIFALEMAKMELEQVKTTFRTLWLANSEVISKVLFTSEQPKRNKIPARFASATESSVFGRYFIQPVWYILKQLAQPSVKVVDIYLHFGE